MSCSIHYTGINEALSMVKMSGQGCLLAKLDLKNAYRTIPVNPNDCSLLGMFWEDQFYLEAELPFDLRLAPKI